MSNATTVPPASPSLPDRPEGAAPGVHASLMFAVQREDPRLEEQLLDRLGPGDKRFFGVTAAGCTLLQLATRPDLVELVGADQDPRQTRWARFRATAARTLNRKDFCRATGISRFEPNAREKLINSVVAALPTEDRAFVKAERAFFVDGVFDDGVFERLWASWRNFVRRFIMPEEQIDRFFDEGDRSVAEAILASPLWPISFEMFFHEALLQEIFGRHAIQHAPPSSFPRHFRTRFDWALRQADAPSNPYLSHVMRGRYGALDGKSALPDFLAPERYERLAQGVERIKLVDDRVDVALRANPGPYQMIQLSNILDWSSEADSDALAEPVLDSLAPGGFLLVRQLNNVRPLPTAWARALDFDPALERALVASDRSFFYSAIRVGRKK